MIEMGHNEPNQRVKGLRNDLLRTWLSIAIGTPLVCLVLLYGIHAPTKRGAFSEADKLFAIMIITVGIVEGLAGLTLPRLGWLRGWRAERISRSTGLGPVSSLRQAFTGIYTLAAVLVAAPVWYALVLYIVGAPTGLALKVGVPAAAATLLMGAHIPGLLDDYERALGAEEWRPSQWGT